MLYRSFEDLPVWKLADTLNGRVIPLVRHARNSGDYRYADQLRGSAISITNNIAEGFERGSRREFIQFLVIAKGSCGEVRSLLNQAIREGMMDVDTLREIRTIAVNVSRQLAGFIRYLRARSK
ncbi:MAG: four helix bundle protein [Bacteroidetes bacterium]|nr:four helix bundle protein [Bacteroidota bacterium]